MLLILCSLDPPQFFYSKGGGDRSVEVTSSFCRSPHGRKGRARVFHEPLGNVSSGVGRLFEDDKSVEG